MKQLTIDGKTYTVYTTTEDSKMTDIAISSIKRRCKSGKIRSLFINGQYLITPQTIDKGITKLPGGRKKKCPVPDEASMATPKSSTTVSRSTPNEKKSIMSSIKAILKLNPFGFIRDTNSPPSSPTQKVSNDEPNTTLLTSWSHSRTVARIKYWT